MDEDTTGHRKTLIDLEQKSQEQLDKALLTLSGGAFGLSLVLLRELFGSTVSSLLAIQLSWLFLGLSIVFVLGSFYSSVLALRRARKQLDEGDDGDAGGVFSPLVDGLNFAGFVFFVGGGIALLVFFLNNVG